MEHLTSRSKRIPIGRSDGRPVYLDPERRAVHTHVIGASGQGKSKFLEHCIREDIKANHGVCLIDPEGDLYENIVAWCAANEIEKIKKVHLFDPSKDDWCFRFNPLYVHPGEKPRHRVDNVIEALAQVWGGEDSRNTPAIRTTLRAVFAALIASGYTMAEAFFLTSTKDKDQIAASVSDRIDNPILREIWDGYNEADNREKTIEFGGARRRLLELLEDPGIRQILAEGENPIDFKEVMDNGDIVLVNLSPEAMGDDPARAFGALLVREMFYCSSRREVAEAKQKPFFAYIDECPDFLTNDITRILARSRKRGLHVVLAHQWLEQLREQGSNIYHGVMGIQNKIVFGGISDEDAVILADQLFRNEYDLEVPIEALTKPGVAGYRRTWLNNWSVSEGESHGQSTSVTDSMGETTVETSGQTVGAGSSSTVNQTYDADGWPTGTYTVSSGGNEMTVDSAGVSIGQSTSHSATETTSYTRSTSESHGASEALEPILKNFVGGVHSLESVRHMAVARLRSIPPRNAVVKGYNTPTFDISTYTIKEPLVSPEWIDRFETNVMADSPYTITADSAADKLLEQQNTLYDEARNWKPGMRQTPGTVIDHDDEGLA
ncbi:MAG: hypothetical protein AAGF25_00540 [Pseudomonadota bacterium]